MISITPDQIKSLNKILNKVDDLRQVDLEQTDDGVKVTCINPVSRASVEILHNGMPRKV